MQLLLIDGVPGSGKSTLAEHICHQAAGSGLNSSWFLEEAKNHPVHPHSGAKRQKNSEYFLSEWERFVSLNEEKGHLLILEGSLFQSTVRFLLDADNEAVIPEYFRECQSILMRCSVKFIYLRPKNVSKHIDWICNHRGKEWNNKVTEYLIATHFCSQRKWLGDEIQKKYWLYYTELCDSLFLETKFPSCKISTGAGYFDKQFDQACQFVEFNKWLNKSL